jgi:hypothetical protein
MLVPKLVTCLKEYSWKTFSNDVDTLRSRSGGDLSARPLVVKTSRRKPVVRCAALDDAAWFSLVALEAAWKFVPPGGVVFASAFGGFHAAAVSAGE